MNGLMKILRGDRFRELFVYGVAGVLTTIINYLFYAGITRGVAFVAGIAPEHGVLILAAKIIAWIASVSFAFWANKKYVFFSRDWSRATLKREIPSFVSARVFSLLFDTAFVEIAVHLMGMNDLIATLIANGIVIVLNYFASKFWIFRKHD